MAYPRDLVLWRLARLLKQARWDATITVVIAAQRVGIAPSTMYAVEAGTLLPGPGTAKALLEVYEATVVLRAAVARLVADGEKAPPWWFADRSVLPPGEGLHLGMEHAAGRIRYYDPIVLPAVLQTDAYAAALYACHPRVTAEQVIRRVGLHRRRRALAGAGRARFDVVVDETVLQRLTAPGFAHARQLDQLLTEADAAGCSVWILPTAAGLHPAFATGGFTIFDFPDIAPGVPTPTVVYRPNVDGAVFLDSAEAVEPYLDIWAALEVMAEEPH